MLCYIHIDAPKQPSKNVLFTPNRSLSTADEIVLDFGGVKLSNMDFEYGGFSVVAYSARK